ncbi:hypothetical protein PZE06_18870 [Robertmurraya sp. DFI.2.37]|uniref:hypothetical protein n=1 Tax=Robertmurraya sp. DFI.2.37 TaxID=3031819 RepID=UPI0023DB70DC|nr:hypothetical protein [Robertmurraya sp. DFI.2.37]MDF1510201.1 hypothetical protein [Robertmurraya sp. DFI.2.37]
MRQRDVSKILRIGAAVQKLRGNRNHVEALSELQALKKTALKIKDKTHGPKLVKTIDEFIAAINAGMTGDQKQAAQHLANMEKEAQHGGGTKPTR